MVCEANETDVDIGIPTVMLPQDAGENLENHILNNSVGMFQFFMCLFFCNELQFSFTRQKFKLTTLYYDS